MKKYDIIYKHPLKVYVGEIDWMGNKIVEAPVLDYLPTLRWSYYIFSEHESKNIRQYFNGDKLGIRVRRKNILERIFGLF